MMRELLRNIAMNGRTPSSLLAPILLFCSSVGFMFVLHPRLGIVDVDGYVYIIGARSLHNGLGFRSINGDPLNTFWPPGYSLLLSPFHNPIFGAEVLNYFSFGVAVSLLYFLLRRSDWTWQTALGFCIILASGFFRLLASVAHADMLTYALFMVAITLATSDASRTLPGLIWAFLVLVRYIAIIFLPSSIAADWLSGQRDWRRLLKTYLPALIAVAITVACVSVFNFLTIGTWTEHSESSLHSIIMDIKLFVFSIPRSFLFSWYGTIFTPFAVIAFSVCMLLAVAAVFSLRPTQGGKWLRAYGISALVCSGLLLFVRDYPPGVRSLGYGMIILTLGFRPETKWANTVWIFYGIVSLIAGIINGIAANSLGANDPRYAALAAAVRPYYTGSEVVATNSFHILDLHAEIPSVPVMTYSEASCCSRILLGHIATLRCNCYPSMGNVASRKGMV